MPGAHRQDDQRNCGATTIVSGQGNVFVEGKLWAVENDQETHNNGQLVSASAGTVFINGKKVIVAPGDQSMHDDAGHAPPLTNPQGASASVYAYEG